MMRCLRSWCLCWLLCAAALAATPPPQPPSVIYGDLFDAVQRAGIYPDSKSFPDATPRAPAGEILAAWNRERRAPGFDLRAFVSKYFIDPETPGTGYHTDPAQGICAHIDALWPVLTRGPDASMAGSLLPLPHRYVVPGGRFREIYYWDSYFTMAGLVASGRRDLAGEMLDNFAWLIDTYGHIPNGNRSYYLSRSQPPFFALMVGLVAGNDESVYAKYLPQLRREHEFWMEGAPQLARRSAHRRVVRLANGAILNRYWDDRAAPRDEAYREDLATAAQSKRPAAEVYRNLRAAAESGWDFSSRWLADGHTLATIRTTELAPVDLNALMYGLESAIARGEAVADRQASAHWREVAEQRARTIREVFWNPKRHTFTDYFWRDGVPADAVTAAGLYPLFLGIADEQQASAVANTLRLTLLRPDGIVPTLVVSGQQWDAPNGWAPLQWIAIGGLRRYQETGLADFIEHGWTGEVAQEFRKTGKLVEKYDVTGEAEARGGEYPTQDGFGWTNGGYRALECGNVLRP